MRYGLAIVVTWGMLFLRVWPAWAEVDSFDILYARPAIGGGPFLTSYDAQTPGRLRVRGGTLAGYAYRPIQFSADSARGGDIIEHIVTLNLHAALGLTDWLAIGFDLPTALYNQFVAPEVAGSVQDNRSAFGDLRLATKIRLLNPDSHWLGIALLPFVDLPTGDAETFMGSDRVGAGAKLIVDTAFLKRVQAAVNVGTVIRSKATRLGVVSNDELNYSGALAISLWRGLSAVGEVFGKTLWQDLFGDNLTSPLELGAGLSYRCSETVQSKVGASVGVGGGAGVPDIRVLAGLELTFPRH